MRVTPLSPKGGSNPRGAPPCPPFRGIFINQSRRAIAFQGMPKRRGRKHDVLEPPRAIIEENVLCYFIK
jgi:hypothetical protein